MLFTQLPIKAVIHCIGRIFVVYSELWIHSYPTVPGIEVYYQSNLAFSPFEPHITGMRLAILKNGFPEYQNDFDEGTKLDKVFTTTEGYQFQNSYRINSDLHPVSQNASQLKLRNFWSYCNSPEHEFELEIRVTKFRRKFYHFSNMY